MDLITVSGPPSSGKTAVIIKTIESLLKRDIKVGVVKFDCLYTDDDILYEKIVDFHTDTQITGSAYDKDGNTIQNAEFILIPEDFDIQTIQGDIYEYIEWIHIDENGTFKRWVEPGNYRILSVKYFDGFND